MDRQGWKYWDNEGDRRQHKAFDKRYVGKGRVLQSFEGGDEKLQFDATEDGEQVQVITFSFFCNGYCTNSFAITLIVEYKLLI